MAGKIHIVVKKTPGKITLCRDLRKFLKNYLDELNKRYLTQMRSPHSAPEPLLMRGADYYSIHEQGSVSVHGYLRRLYLEEHGELPENSIREQVAGKLSAAVHLAGARFGKKGIGSDVGHRFMFGISDAMSKAWLEAGVDPDQALRAIINETFDRYRQTVMGGAELGYAVGIHHDTAHIHAHVALMAFADDGKQLKLSNGSKMKMADGTLRRVDVLNLLIGTANTVLAEYNSRFLQPKSPVPQVKTPQVEIQRWVQLAAWDRVPDNLTPSETVTRALREVSRLQNAKPEEILTAIQSSYNKRRQALRAARESQNRQALKDAEKLARQKLDDVFVEQRKLREQEKRLRELRRLTVQADSSQKRLLRKIIDPRPNRYERLAKADKSIETDNFRLSAIDATTAGLHDLLTQLDVDYAAALHITNALIINTDFNNAIEVEALRTLEMRIKVRAAARKQTLQESINKLTRALKTHSLRIEDAIQTLEILRCANRELQPASMMQLEQILNSPELLRGLGIKNTSDNPENPVLVPIEEQAEELTPELTEAIRLSQEIVEPEEEQERQWEPDHREPAAPSPPAQELALLLARGRSPSR